MNIHTASTSLKPFKRKHWLHYLVNGYDGHIYFNTDKQHKYPYKPAMEDLKAEDWEVEEKRVEITEAQLKQLFADYNVELGYMSMVEAYLVKRLFR